MLIEVRGDDDDCFSSEDLSVDLRTAPTRSFASLDHDSIRLCASQQAAGPSPLIFVPNNSSIQFKTRSLFRPAPIVRRALRMTFTRSANFQIQRKLFAQ